MSKGGDDGRGDAALQMSQTRQPCAPPAQMNSDLGRPNTLHDVRAQGLDRTPSEAVRPGEVRRVESPGRHLAVVEYRETARRNASPPRGLCLVYRLMTSGSWTCRA